MNINRACKIHLAASKEAGRYATDFINLVKKPDGTAQVVATTGQILAVVPVRDADEDTAGLIPANIFAEITKGGLRPEFAHLQANGTVSYQPPKSPGRVECKRDEDGRVFPAWDQVIPKEGAATFKFAINPQFLLDLARAIGSPDKIHLELSTPEKPILVRPGKEAPEPEALGVIMPLTIHH